MGRELEVKFRATPETLHCIEETLGGTFQEIRMRTFYYDTPGWDLAARKWTLRRRMENDSNVCTLKTPAGGYGRNEWETECDDIFAVIPLLAAESGLPELQTLAEQQELLAMCAAVFVRRCRLLDLGGTTVELALDQGVLLGGMKELPFAEVEIELKSGSEDTLLLFARKLQGDYGLTTEHASKFARAKALAKEEPHGT